MNNLQYWIWLSKIPKLGAVRKKRLLEKYKSPEKIYNLKKEELLQIDGIGEETAKIILSQVYKNDLAKDEEYLLKNDIKLINICEKEYPEKLKNIYDSPISLYVKGNIEILNKFSLAVIGCRENSSYGERVSKRIVKSLVKNDIVTISGLAKGIDSIAHKETLNEKGKTIAVIGSGLDYIYPKENEQLANKIVKQGGTLISEYPIGTKPERLNFPARNRIISGLSNGVIVVEAKKKSGTIITVDFALEQGKEVFVVPGNIDSVNSEGTNELAKEGAKIITSIKDIMEEYVH